ncbi:MAG: hypothetical protein HRT87_08640, partial [Legionellales bacterium]|nr:hypothetical protein [Legionellales bacterium]
MHKKIILNTIKFNLIILLLWHTLSGYANEISLANESNNIYGQLPNGDTQFNLTDGKIKIPYLCIIILSEPIAEFSQTIKPEFDIWDETDKGKILTFRFTWQTKMAFTITNNKNNNVDYNIQCLKQSSSESEHDQFKYITLNNAS